MYVFCYPLSAVQKYNLKLCFSTDISDIMLLIPLYCNALSYISICVVLYCAM